MFALLAAFATAQAEVSIRGVLEAGPIPEPFSVDSVFMDAGGSPQWFVTAGWATQPNAQDTFLFPPYRGWPMMVMLSAFAQGQMVLQTIPQPVRDEWYTFEPPFELVRVQFHELTGIEERLSRADKPAFSVQPAVIRDAAVIRASGAGLVEIYDAAGNVVQSMTAPTVARWSGDDRSGRKLAAGIYFCRLTGDAGSAVCRVVLAR
jgi:hypothetical protein